MTINIDILDKSSIENAVKQIEAYEKELKEKTQKVVQEVAQESVNNYNARVASISGNDDLNQTASDTGASLGKISDTEYSVNAEGQALFLEFGTGITNADNPTARAELKSSTNVVQHGEYGNKNALNPNGWVYKVGDEYKLTKGFNAQAPLYETKKETKELLKKKVEDIFK